MDRIKAFIREKGDLVYSSEKGCTYPLDKNENLFIPREVIREIMVNAISRIDPRTYPGGEEEELIWEIAKTFSIDHESIVITNGGDEAIDLLLTLVGSLGERPRIAILKPSFPMYSLRSLLRGYRVEYIELSENGFSIDVDRAIEIASRSDLVFLCSPNNPTGNLLPRDVIKSVAEASKGIVVLDQAYREFAEDPQDDLLKSYENIVAIRTFSKAYGLAGLRLGYIVANREIAKALKILRLPFQMNKFTLAAGVEALRMRDRLLRYVDDVKRARKILVARLRDIDYLEVYDTQTNFVLTKIHIDPGKVVRALEDRGICVKLYRGLFREGDSYLRITVPEDSIIELLVGVLENVG
ncbi:MAG: aminotransferase class I/II-fold pyridoxal phosphate-dependent enzyme [Sulfolobales archaeon]